MMLIFYYIFLIASTYLIFRNAKKSWTQYHDFILPVATVIIFYFTLIGAFIFPLDAYLDFAGAKIGLHYTPIFERLFPVVFDGFYFLSVVYYVAFIFITQYIFLMLIRRKGIQKNETIKLPSVTINPYAVLIVSVLLIGISAFFLRNEIFQAIKQGTSIYISTRSNSNRFYTIHQLANEFAVLLPFMAYGLLVIKSKFILIRKSKGSFYILFFACMISAFYIAVLGNRREILSGLVFCLMLAIPYAKSLDRKKLLLLFVFSLGLFTLNVFFRSPAIPRTLHAVFIGYPSKNTMNNEKNSSVTKQEEKRNEEHKRKLPKTALSSRIRNTLAPVVFSNELFYAHFSMYGVLKKNIPITYGSSFVNLGVSFIPRFLITERPQNIYEYYAESVKSVPGQNYTLHHATAWYLNFGWIGLVLGAMVLGGLFFFSFYGYNHILPQDKLVVVLLKFLTPFLICAQLVSFITTGPEAYKSMLLEGIILPVLLLLVSLDDFFITKWVRNFNLKKKKIVSDRQV